MRNNKSRRAALMGMLFALAIVLSFVESLITPLLGLMPAIKLGLSNIVVMYALLFLPKRYAAALVLLKALFAFLTRGATAGLLSLMGGGLSFLILCLLLCLPGTLSGYVFSACGALAHNLGQLAGAAVILSSSAALAYSPVLMIAGLIVGGITWMLLRALLPYFKHISAENTGGGEKWKKLR